MNRRLLLLFVSLLALLAPARAGHDSPSFLLFETKATEGRPLNVVFFGGSLSWGANASDPQRTSWRALMSDHLREKFPRAAFTFHDATIGGTGSKLGLFRLQRDVLTQAPDLVFYEFTMNDGAEDADLEALASYEGLLREMIDRGIPVMQVFTCFKYHMKPEFDARTLPRYVAHRKLAEAYHTAVGDGLGLMQDLFTAGQLDLKEIWPFDGAHPDDPGYRLFFNAVRDGFDAALSAKTVCVLPPAPVFSDKFKTHVRQVLVEGALPEGWARQKTFRTSLWFDGLSSRWMGDVAACGGKDAPVPAPLTVEFTGTLVGLFGEKNGTGLAFKAKIDGQPVLYHKDKKSEPEETWPNDTARFGAGNLFSWIELSSTLAPGRHRLEITPVLDPAKPEGQLRIESVCSAGE